MGLPSPLYGSTKPLLTSNFFINKNIMNIFIPTSNHEIVLQVIRIL